MLYHIGKKLDTDILYSQGLHILLVNHTNYLKQQRVLTGGSPRRKFFQKTWHLRLETVEIKTKCEQVLEAELPCGTD